MQSKKNNVAKVRMLKIEIEHFKNVSYGTIEFPTNHMIKKHGTGIGRDVLGIYGQNGSGKTALVEAMMVWQLLIQDKAIPENLKELIKDDTRIKITFLMQMEEQTYQVEQELSVNRKIEVRQKQSYRRLEQGKWSRKLIIKPDRKGTDAKLLPILKHYAANGLWIVTTRQLGLVNLNIGTTVDFAYNEENGELYEEQQISLFEENIFPKAELPKISRMIEQLNIVMHAVLPGFQILLETKEEGELCRVLLMAERYGDTFPLKSESGGLKRILSILTILIAGYNSSSLCIVIDEVDAGIFEFLLGELLEMMRNGAKGQFLFTSHNLRALEVLGKDHIIFSTANPNNRYIQFSPMKKNVNLRDEYLRTLLLGGQKENVYEEVQSYEIGYAFRKAGKLYDEA